MIKFFKYMLAYFCDKEPAKQVVSKVYCVEPGSDKQPDLLDFMGMSPMNMITVKTRNKWGSDMLVMGGLTAPSMEPTVMFTMKDSEKANGFGHDLAELFMKYEINLSVKGNLGTKEDNVVTNIAVNYLEQV